MSSTGTLLLTLGTTLSTLFLGRILLALALWPTGIVIYRLYFHPLAKYPGPFLGRISGLYDFYIACKEHRAQNFELLHQKYGPIVRFAPNDLSYNSPVAFKEIYGFGANVRKGSTFQETSADPETTSTHSEPNQKRAMKKRKILGMGFSESALKAVEPFILEQIQIFCKCLIDPKTEKVKDMSLWLNYLAYDIVGEVVFGQGFTMMTDPSTRWILPFIDSMLFSMLLGSCMPILVKTGFINLLFPQIATGRSAFIKHALLRVEHRVEQKPENQGRERKDIFTYLLEAKDIDDPEKPLSKKTLLTEGVLLLLAGSDTTSTGLAAAIFYLLKHPRCMERLHNELRQTFSAVEEIRSGPKLASCLYLRACVEEALRMNPPGPGPSPRTVLPGGQIIQGEYIPEGVTLNGAKWSLGYNTDYFPDAHVFRPERYQSGEGDSAEEVQRARSGAYPFGYGVRKCLGVKMAYQELYLTIATLVYLFEISPEQPQELKANFHMLDHFNAKKCGPYASFRLRDGQSL